LNYEVYAPGTHL